MLFVRGHVDHEPDWLFPKVRQDLPEKFVPRLFCVDSLIAQKTLQPSLNTAGFRLTFS
jgi:hypothetical protein